MSSNPFSALRGTIAWMGWDGEPSRCPASFRRSWKGWHPVRPSRHRHSEKPSERQAQVERGQAEGCPASAGELRTTESRGMGMDVAGLGDPGLGRGVCRSRIPARLGRAGFCCHRSGGRRVGGVLGGALAGRTLAGGATGLGLHRAALDRLVDGGHGGGRLDPVVGRSARTNSPQQSHRLAGSRRRVGIGALGLVVAAFVAMLALLLAAPWCDDSGCQLACELALSRKATQACSVQVGSTRYELAGGHFGWSRRAARAVEAQAVAPVMRDARLAARRPQRVDIGQAFPRSSVRFGDARDRHARRVMPPPEAWRPFGIAPLWRPARFSRGAPPAGRARGLVPCRFGRSERGAGRDRRGRDRRRPPAGRAGLARGRGCHSGGLGRG